MCKITTWNMCNTKYILQFLLHALWFNTMNILKLTSCSSHCAHIHHYGHALTKLWQILHTGNDRIVGKLFYTIVHSLMIGQWGPKHLEVSILTDCCKSNKVCAFASHIVTFQLNMFPAHYLLSVNGMSNELLKVSVSKHI